MAKKGRVSDADIIIGQNLKRIRVRHGLTQSAFGKLGGITSQQVHKYENGSNRISASKIVLLSEKIGEPIEVFFKGLRSDNGNELDNFDFLSNAVLEAATLLEKVSDPNITLQIKKILQKLLEEEHKNEEN